MFTIIAGFALFVHMKTVSDIDSSGERHVLDKVPRWLYVVLSAVCVLYAGLWAFHKSSVSYHPIDMLLYEAQSAHEDYVSQISVSKTLGDAARNYRDRHGRHPPPGFHHWYEYATERKSAIIDDYDSIHRDLLAFYALTPAEIRERTWDIISNPWNDAAGISIRNGVVAISPNVVPTHRWMLDGVVDMIGHFAQWLPDMDLAFNLNDECRVAVPFGIIERMRGFGADFSGLDRKPRNSFSAGRDLQWKSIPEPPNTESPLIELSFQRTFYDFGSVGCSPGSPARTNRDWDVGSLCTSCAAPHSLGAFLANWTISADVCHQPDLANLHGLYLSPAAFKGAHDLYPIFSQSKANGYNDILYPSAWNYIDKARYGPTDEHPDPPFADKNATLFWRGATSEGVSPGQGQWKGMTRQRFVHLANDVNRTAAAQALLLPKRGSQQLAYQSISTPELTSLLPTDVHVVEFIARCGGRDCPEQAHEFAPLVAPSDFQAHWQYRYLLDLDGAGFSGRFLPFLHSHSLPFKAGIFREWWDDRVTAWLHFVPLDVRGHGFWATLAYFTGIDGLVKGRQVLVAPHTGEAQRLAESGREWAAKVLRKEDMEIYFFRLLLEWGRLTDDQRADLGYDGVG